MTEKNLVALEKNIRGKMLSIKNGTAPRDTGIGGCFTLLKKNDEVLYSQLLEEYKIVLQEYKDNHEEK